MAYIKSQPFKPQFEDANGNPLTLGTVELYLWNTSTPTPYYTDNAGTLGGTSFTLNSLGKPPNDLFFDSSIEYKLVTKDAAGSVIDTMGPYSVGFSGRDLSDATSLSSGDALIAVKQPYTNATATTQHVKNQDRINAFDFFSEAQKLDVRARTLLVDVTAALQNAITYAVSVGGCLDLPAGSYLVSSALTIAGSNFSLIGAGVDCTKIITNSTTANVFTQTGDRSYLYFAHFTVGSSVTKSAGAHFDMALARRSVFYHVKLTDWFNGVFLRQGEIVLFDTCYITKPSGAGSAAIIGTAGAAGQVSGCAFSKCFIRGNDDVTAGAPVALYGLDVYDVDALTDYSSDIGSFVNNDMRVTPTNRAANFFFTQTQFDATKSSDCILLQGAGVKQQWAFANIWIASAGKLTGGNAEAVGINFSNNGTYSDINYVGGRIYNCSGSGLLMVKGGGLLGFTGVNFLSNGKSATTNKYNAFINPAAANSLGLTFSGCHFSDGGTKDIYFAANSRDYAVSGGATDSGVTDLGANKLWEGMYDKSSNTIASATTIDINPTQRFYNISGTTNIAGITATFADHIITLKFAGVLTVVDASSNIELNGNFITATNSTLTLICDGATWFEVSRKA